MTTTTMRPVSQTERYTHEIAKTQAECDLLDYYAGILRYTDNKSHVAPLDFSRDNSERFGNMFGIEKKRVEALLECTFIHSMIWVEG